MKSTIYTVLLVILSHSLESNAQTGCNSNPCLNDGTCYNSEAGHKFLCLCITGYTGVQCEISLPGTCPPNYNCQNGNCRTDITGTPHCNCYFGYVGEACDIWHGGTCPPNYNCQNGNCLWENTAPRCNCYFGYGGEACDIWHGETACKYDAPCKHGGVCFTSSSDISSYLCDCSSGFTGIHCETMVTSIQDPCLPNPCQHGANCSLDEYNPTGYNCACLIHFSGQNCSTDDRLTCTFDGRTYNNKEVRETECNLCTCDDGMWSCTDSTCGGMCQYEDMIFMENDSREDDCNTCYCLYGEWMCTEKRCFDGDECELAVSDYIELYDENEFRWEECNVCYCLSGLWACTTKSCSNRTVITVSFEFDNDFDSVSYVIEPFKIMLHEDLSTTYDIPKQVIEHIEVDERNQKTEVSFSLVGSQDGAIDVEKMLSKIQEPLDNGEYIFFFNDVRYQSKQNTFTSTQVWPENPTKDQTGIDSTVVLIVVCAVTGLGFIVIVLGVILYIRTANTKRGDTKYGNAQLPNKRTGLDNGDQTRLTRDRATTLPSHLHI